MTVETPKKDVPKNEKLDKIKLAFMYTLIAGLVASAIISVIAILVGDINSALQKGFGTIFTFLAHSLVIFGLIWSDKNDAIGRKIIPTTLLGVALASLVTSTLGTWNIISSEKTGQAILFYLLVSGSAFIVAGVLKLRIDHKITKYLAYSTAGLVAVWALVLTPWVFKIVANFDPLYFRVVGALTIMASTLLMVTAITRAIALSSNPKLKATKPADEPLPGGLLAYYIVLGIFIVIVWLGGMVSLIVDSAQREYRDVQRYEQEYEVKPRSNYR